LRGGGGLPPAKHSCGAPKDSGTKKKCFSLVGAEGPRRGGGETWEVKKKRTEIPPFPPGVGGVRWGKNGGPQPIRLFFPRPLWAQRNVGDPLFRGLNPGLPRGGKHGGLRLIRSWITAPTPSPGKGAPDSVASAQKWRGWVQIAEKKRFLPKKPKTCHATPVCPQGAQPRGEGSRPRGGWGGGERGLDGEPLRGGGGEPPKEVLLWQRGLLRGPAAKQNTGLTRAGRMGYST